MQEKIFGSYISERPFCSNGAKIDFDTALLKTMITYEDQKEKFACALQNSCSVIIRKPQGKRLSQSAVSETFSYGLLKTDLHRWHFFRNVPAFFGETISQSTSERLIKKDIYIV